MVVKGWGRGGIHILKEIIDTSDLKSRSPYIIQRDPEPDFELTGQCTLIERL